MALSGTSAHSIPQFNGENYEFWCIKFKTVLRAFDLWDVVNQGMPSVHQGVTYAAAVAGEGGTPAHQTPAAGGTQASLAASSTSSSASVGPAPIQHGVTQEQLKDWQRKDADALAKIHGAVTDAIFPRIMNSTTAKEAWDTLRDEFQGTARARTTRLQNLRRNFETMHMKEGENIQSYSTRFLEVVNQMKALGDEMSSQRVVEKLLVTLTEKFDTVVGIIEQTRDLSTLTPIEVIGSLQAQEQRNVTRTEASTEGALAVKHQFRAAKYNKGYTKKEKAEASEGKHGGKKKFPQCGICGKTNHLEKKCWKRGKPKCTYCHKFGHLEQDCRLKKGGQEVVAQTNAAEVEEHLFMAQQGRDLKSKVLWMIDSGCTSHMTMNEEYFVRLDKSVRVPVKLADGKYVMSSGRGVINVETSQGVKAIKDVLFVPQLDLNLISVGQMMEEGYKLAFEDNTCVIKDSKKRLVACIGMRNKSFELEWRNAGEAVCRAHEEEESLLWHMRFGHFGVQSLKQLSRTGMVRDMPAITDLKNVCEGCQLGKQSRQAFPSGVAWRASQKLQLVHSDICGPMRTESLEGSKYFILFIDDHSRMAWVYFIKEKSESFRVFQEFKNRVESESDCALKCIRTDNGKEYTSLEFDRFCRDQGVKHQLTVPYSPQQNGVCERRNRTVMNMARSMMFSKGMPNNFWAEAVNTAIYLQNRCITKALEKRTPYEAWFGCKPTVRHLKVFGSLCYYHVPAQKRSKLDPRANKAVFIGYSSQSKGYRVYDLKTKKIVVSRDVTFDEAARWNWEEKKEVGCTITFLEPAKISSEETLIQDTENTSNHGNNPTVSNSSGPSPPGPNLPGSNSSGASSQSSSSNRSGSSQPSPLRYRNLASLYEELPQIEEGCNNVTEDPCTFEEASQEGCWKQAMDEEISMIQKNKTWRLSDLPEGKKAIGVKWIFRTKVNPDGSIQKHKARLVVKGFAQQFGVDYTDTFAPVSRLDTVRTILALAAAKGWSVYQLDVKSAFLNGWLKEDIYIEQPQGYQVIGQESKVLKLNKALYGLKQAPRAWYSRIDEHFAANQFLKSPSEHTLYTKRKSDSDLLIVSLYVDDLIVTGSSEAMIQEFKNQMKSQFEMTDLGKMQYFLGIEVLQNSDGIFIHQNKYAKGMLKKFNMLSCKPVSTPLIANQKFHKEGDTSSVDASLYRSMIGSLLYLTATRPDIMYTTSLLSRFMQSPTTDHLVAAKRVLRYVKGTLESGIMYAAGQNIRLTGYCDSDWAGSTYDLKSTTGYVFNLGSGSICWSSHKQETVAQSTAEAEYIAACAAVNHTIWLRRILVDLGETISKPTRILCDNKSAIAIAKNPVLHRRTKHIMIKYHFIREAEGLGEVNLVHCSTNDQFADIFTKGLHGSKLETMRKRIGVCTISIKGEI